MITFKLKRQFLQDTSKNIGAQALHVPETIYLVSCPVNLLLGKWLKTAQMVISLELTVRPFQNYLLTINPILKYEKINIQLL